MPLLNFQYENWVQANTTLTTTIRFLTPSINGTSTGWLLNYYDALRQYACVMDAYGASDPSRGSVCLQNLITQYTYLGPYMNMSVEHGFQVGARSYFALSVNIAEAKGALLAAQQLYTSALAQLDKADALEAQIPYNEPPIYSRPVLATKANVYLRMGNYDLAVSTYRQILLNPWHNNSGFDLFGIGYSYALAQRRSDAINAFKIFLKTWASADQTLWQVVYAKSYINITAETCFVVITPTNSEHVIITLAIACVILLFTTLVLLFHRLSGVRFTSPSHSQSDDGDIDYELHLKAAKKNRLV